MKYAPNLKDRNVSLQDFVKNSPAALAMIDRETRFIEVSPLWVQLFGKTWQELVGRAPHDVFPAWPSYCWAAIQRGLAGESLHVGEDEIIRDDGSSVWFRLELTPWRDVEGEIGGVILFVENITTQKAIDAILRMISVEIAELGFDDFLNHCTRRIAEILGFEWVQLVQPCADQPGWAETIATYADGQALETIRYPLASSPDEMVLRRNVCIFPSEVSALFPDDANLFRHGIEGYGGCTLIGSTGELLAILTVMSRRPIHDIDRLRAILRLTGVALGAALERRRAEEIKQHRTRHNWDLLNNLSSHVAVLDSFGEILFTNGAWNDFAINNGSNIHSAGIGVNYLAVCDDAGAMSPEAAKAAELIRDVIAGRVRQDRFEYPCHSEQQQRWFYCTVKNFEDSQKGLILVSHVEITEIKLAQRRSEELERRFRHLFECAPEAMIMVSGSGIIRLINRKAGELFGYTSIELVDQPVETLINPEKRASHALLRKAFTDSKGKGAMGDARGTLKGFRRDGMEFPAEISLSRFSGEEEEYIMVSVRDVTVRREAEADRMAREVAEQANMAKSAFLATMSHEIRTPLNAVLGLSEVLARSPLSDDQTQMLGDMRGSARHLLHLIDNVLDLSKIEAGNLELDLSSFDLHDLLESSARGMSNLATERGVLLHLFVAPTLPRLIVSDQVRLRQIVYNLLGNAIKFSGGESDRQGRVMLRAEHEPGAAPVLRLTVRDNGIGMTPEVIQKVFEPFTQGTSTTTRKFGGTGLGLTITKRIVAGLGGEISIESTPGEGATIFIRLPLEQPPEPAVEPPARLTGLRCLVAKCDDYLAADLAAYLEHEGAHVNVIAVGAEQEGALADDSVLILGSGDMRPSGGAPFMPQVLIGSGESLRLEVSEPGRIFVETRGLSRDDLVNAVALASGRSDLGNGDAAQQLAGRDVKGVISDAENSLSILVAEDDALNQKVILRQLELLGLSADIAEDGVEALRLWRARHYDLLLSDLHMPNMDGYAMARTIREAEAGTDARVTILALTADAMSDAIGRTRKAGFDGFMTKPVTLAKLAETLAVWLPRSVFR